MGVKCTGVSWFPTFLGVLDALGWCLDLFRNEVEERLWWFTGVVFGSKLQRMVNDMLFGDGEEEEQQQQARPTTECKLHIAGLGKTGTTSLGKALTQLGYTLFDIDAMLEEDEDVIEDFYEYSSEEERILTLAQRSNNLHQDLAELGYNASILGASTYPWAAEQAHHKVILTVRDADEWVDSRFRVWEDGDVLDILHSRPFVWLESVKKQTPFFEDRWRRIPTQGNDKDYLNATVLKRGFLSHIHSVIATVPAEQLLVFDVKQGWEPLCRFLDLPVPDGPFPHVNDRSEARTIMMTLHIICWTWPVFVGFLPGLVVVVTVHLRRRGWYLSRGASRANTTRIIERKVTKIE